MDELNQSEVLPVGSAVGEQRVKMGSGYGPRVQIGVGRGGDAPHCSGTRRIDLAVLAEEGAAVDRLGKLDDRLGLAGPALKPRRADEAEAESTARCRSEFARC